MSLPYRSRASRENWRTRTNETNTIEKSQMRGTNCAYTVPCLPSEWEGSASSTLPENFQPAMPVPLLLFDKDKRIAERKANIDPGSKYYFPVIHHHENIKAVIHAYEEGKLDHIREAWFADGLLYEKEPHNKYPRWHETKMFYIDRGGGRLTGVFPPNATGNPFPPKATGDSLPSDTTSDSSRPNTTSDSSPPDLTTDSSSPNSTSDSSPSTPSHAQHYVPPWRNTNLHRSWRGG